MYITIQIYNLNKCSNMFKSFQCLNGGFTKRNYQISFNRSKIKAIGAPEGQNIIDHIEIS